MSGAVFVRSAGLGEVGTIDRKMQHVEFERLTQTVCGEIAGRVMAARNAGQQARQHGEFAGKQRFQHPPFCLLQYRLKPRRLITKLPPDLVQRIETIACNQHLRDRIQPFITGRAVHAGKRAKCFILAEDLFDHEVKRRGLVALRGPHQAAQPLAILRGIPQAVDVIEPQPVKPAFCDQPGNQPVRRRKSPGVLDPQARQRIDVEEAAIVDITRCQSPMRDPVVLPLQEVMKGEVLSGAPGSGAVCLEDRVQ